MKVPDKIYVLSFRPVLNGVFMSSEDRLTKNAVEYICKSSILEWLYDRQDVSIMDVIQKIEEL